MSRSYSRRMPDDRQVRSMRKDYWKMRAAEEDRLLALDPRAYAVGDA